MTEEEFEKKLKDEPSWDPWSDVRPTPLQLYRSNLEFARKRSRQYLLSAILGLIVYPFALIALGVYIGYLVWS